MGDSLCSITASFPPPFPLVTILPFFASLLSRWTASDKMRSERFSSKTFKFSDFKKKKNLCNNIYLITKEKEFTWWTLRHWGTRGGHKKKKGHQKGESEQSLFSPKGFGVSRLRMAQSTRHAWLLGKPSNVPPALESHTTGSRWSPFQVTEREKPGCFSLP